MEAATERATSIRPTLVLAGTALSLYAADQVSKAIVVATVNPGERFDVIGQLVQLWHVHNTERPSASSRRDVALRARHHPRHRHGRVLPSDAARPRALDPRHPRRDPGALGNLTDRLRLGWVTDFVSIGFAEMRFRLQHRRLGGRARDRRARHLSHVPRASAVGRGDAVTAPVEDRTVEGIAPPGRTDLAVASVAGISRAHAQRLIGDGRALVEGRRRRASDRLAGGEKVTVELSAPPDTSLEPESIPLAVAYEDDGMLIVDKPAGLVVHPAAGHGGGTLVNALLGRARDRGEPLGSIAGVGRPGIVHRLDKETSGLLAVAKTDAAQASLMRQFGERSSRQGVPGPRSR